MSIVNGDLSTGAAIPRDSKARTVFGSAQFILLKTLVVSRFIAVLATYKRVAFFCLVQLNAVAHPVTINDNAVRVFTSDSRRCESGGQRVSRSIRFQDMVLDFTRLWNSQSSSIFLSVLLPPRDTGTM
jgi:hypothetical protein